MGLLWRGWGYRDGGGVGYWRGQTLGVIVEGWVIVQR